MKTSATILRLLALAGTASLVTPLASLRATVSLPPASTVQPTPHDLGSNLVTNPGFETGDTTGYTVTPAASGSDYQVDNDPEYAHGGSYSFDFAGTTAGSYDTLSQTLTTVPGATYNVSFWLVNFDGVGGGVPAGVNADPNGNGFMSSFGNTPLLSFTDSDAFGYTQFTYTATATDASTVLSFAGYQVPSGMNLDDISVNQVPEPSTWAMLGLGVASLGVVTLRRRVARA